MHLQTTGLWCAVLPTTARDDNSAPKKTKPRRRQETERLRNGDIGLPAPFAIESILSQSNRVVVGALSNAAVSISDDIGRRLARVCTPYEMKTNFACSRDSPDRRQMPLYQSRSPLVNITGDHPRRAMVANRGSAKSDLPVLDGAPAGPWQHRAGGSASSDEGAWHGPAGLRRPAARPRTASGRPR